MQQRWRPLFALGTPLLAICTVGAAVEFCWAAGEAVLVPYLGRHGVRRWVVSTIYLSNPTLGLWVQPRLGAWSDRINRRIPFVVALSLIALVGIGTLISAVPLAKALGLESINNGSDEERLPALAIILSFVGFGAADICFDCLLIPGRALLDDIAVPAVRSEANALFTGFQLGGRLAALVVCSSSWTTSGLWGLYADLVDAHFDACLTVSALFLVVSTSVVVLLVNDKGSTFEEISDDAETNDAAEVEFRGQTSTHHDEKGMLLSTPSRQNCSNSTVQSWRFKLDASALLCAVQAAGWVGVCAQSFFWTSWRGEEMGCIDLALQGVVGMATAGALPLANARFGASSVWCGSELFFHLLMMSVGLVSSTDASRGCIPRIIAALSGVNYAVHATNGLIVAAGLVADPSKRARTIAMVNNALPMGQLITASTGGAIAQLFGGFEYSLVCYGIVGALVTSAVWIVSSKRNLFSGGKV